MLLSQKYNRRTSYNPGMWILDVADLLRAVVWPASGEGRLSRGHMAMIVLAFVVGGAVLAALWLLGFAAVAR